MNGEKNLVKFKKFIQSLHIKTDPYERPFLAFPLGGLYTLYSNKVMLSNQVSDELRQQKMASDVVAGKQHNK